MMSQPQAQPRHRPTPFKFPGFPLSPPETIESRSVRMMSRTAADELRPAAPTPESMRAQSAPDWAPARSTGRRTSSIGYFNSGVLDASHERPQKTHKAFIIVIPPPSFSQDDGEIATLGLGPRHRLSQGLVVPLCSTMYGQLNVIAREFSFPSTTGICLYMSFNEDGIVMKPRILDDAWPILWRHALESDPAQVSRSPISGKVEFDIDMHQARWYTSWISSLQRSHLQPNFYSAPSISHSRAESRMTFRDDETNADPPPAAATEQTSNSRYMPRKLTLVDRHETASNLSASTHRSFLSPEKSHQIASALSPIFQESEPQSARSALHYKVENWRATSTSKTKLLAATGQPSLEAPNLPNAIPVEDSTPALTDEEDDGIHMSDYQWSISSAGPPDYDPASPSVWDGPPSIHLMQRNQGSVCLTPSTHTSFGPDDSLWSPISSVARLRSPDIAYRMMEDCPPTPSTATSWGAPLEWPVSPVIHSRPRSVHLADRGEFSRPVTPSTATSWGPPSPLPSPPFRRERPRSLHMADRDGISRPVTPDVPDVQVDELEYSYSAGDYRPFGLSFPYLSRETSQNDGPWALSWPHFSPSAEALRSYNYPYLIIYEPVYPHFDLYPSIPGGKSPVTDIPQDTPISVKLQSVYPVFDLYPAVYPWNLNAIYPAAASLPARGDLVSREKVISVKCPADYPLFDLYPAVYPWNLEEIYPVLPVSADDMPSSNRGLSVKLRAVYPFFDLYASVYPWNLQEIYPAIPFASPQHDGEMTSAITTKIEVQYPAFDLYPAVYPWNLQDIYPTLVERKADSQTKSIVIVEKGVNYPNFDLYPAVYPWNLEEIYPPVASPSETTELKVTAVQVKLPVHYPNLDLYAPVYPWNLENIYPVLLRSTLSSQEETIISSKLQGSYPYFDLYPAVYPWNLEVIYPPIAVAPSQTLSQPKALSIKLPALYPNFNLYSAVYPWNLDEIYPPASVATAETSETSPISTRLPTAYPNFDLYAPVYPWNLDKIYPNTQSKIPSNKHTRPEHSPVVVKLRANYPAFDLYEPVYPWNLRSIHPSIEATSEHLSSQEEVAPVCRPWHYPHFHLYPSVYPYFDLYPELQPTMAFAELISTQVPESAHHIVEAVPAPVKVVEPQVGSEPPATPSRPATWDNIFRNLTAKRQSQASSIQQSPVPVKKISSRLTHAELHAIVTMEDASFAQRISSIPISPSSSSLTSSDHKHFESRSSISSFASSMQSDDRFPGSPTARDVPATWDLRRLTGFDQDGYSYDLSPTRSDFSRPMSQEMSHLVGIAAT